jgi:putative oxidoreductase
MLNKLVALYLKVIAQVDKLKGLVPLIIRLSVGIPFVVTGWGKLHNLDQIIGYFTSLGIPAPQIQAPFVAGLEFFGGIALILGLGARFFAAPMMMTMVVAILTAKRDKIEDWTDLFDFIEWHYLVFFLVIALIGAGPFSLDYLIGKKLIPSSALPPGDPRTPTSTSSSPPP